MYGSDVDGVVSLEGQGRPNLFPYGRPRLLSVGQLVETVARVQNAGRVIFRRGGVIRPGSYTKDSAINIFIISIACFSH